MIDEVSGRSDSDQTASAPPPAAHSSRRRFSVFGLLMAVAVPPIAFAAWGVSAAQFAPDDRLDVDLIRHTTLHVWCITSIALLAATVLALRRPPAPRRRWIAVVLLLLPPWVHAAGIATPWRLLPLRHNQTSAPESVVRVLAWNVLSTNPSHAAVRDAVARVDADVVALIECDGPLLQSLEPLRGRYPHWSPDAGGPAQGIIVFSRVPGIHFRTIPMGSLAAVEATWSTADGDRKHRVLFVHTTSPRQSPRIARRGEELAIIGRWAAECSGGPAAVAGDLNTTPYTPVFRELLRVGGLADTRAYRGYFASWHAALGDFGIPIDHALVNRHIRLGYRGVAAGEVGSDHRGVVFELE